MKDELTITRDDLVDAVASRIISEPIFRMALDAEVSRRISAMDTLTAEEVAEKLKVPVARVYKLPIPRADIGGRTVRYPVASFEKFLASRMLRTPVEATL